MNKIKEKINVLIVCHDSLLYGASQSLLNWIDGIYEKENIYNFIFVLPSNKGELYNELRLRDCEVITYKYYSPIWKYNKKTLSVYIKNIVRILLSYVVNPITLTKLKNLCKKRRIKIIHSNSLAVLIGAQLSEKTKIPHVWHVREYMEEDHMLKMCCTSNNIKKYYENSYSIFISNAIKQKYDTLFLDNKKTVIYNEVKYDKEYKKERKFMEDGVCNIIIAGKISRNKGQKEAILAIDELNKKGIKCILYICGEGEYQQELQALVDKNRIENVKFLGFRNDLKELRKKMDIALVCSKSEAFGRVTVEAMYYENLVIGANTAATVEIIKDNVNGYLYNINSYKDLADKLDLAIINKNESIRIINNSKTESINKYSNNIYKKIFEVYEIVRNDVNAI